MAAWWLISHNFAHQGFEKCLKISPESQSCSARRNVTARLGLSDAGTASRDAGMCRRKTLWMASSSATTQQQLEKTSGRAPVRLGLHVSALLWPWWKWEVGVGVNILQGMSPGRHTCRSRFGKQPLRNAKVIAQQSRQFNLWKSRGGEVVF